MSSEFVRKQGFKLKKIERLVYVRNVDSSFNKEVIKYTVEDIYYQKYRERMDIDVIRRQKWKVILGMLWLVQYNHEIDWRTEEVKMTRCPEEWKKQQILKQKKLGRKKQKEEEKNQKEREVRRKGKIKKKKKKSVKLEEEAKKLVSPRFYKQIYVFGKKVSERMLVKKI